MQADAFMGTDGSQLYNDKVASKEYAVMRWLEAHTGHWDPEPAQDELRDLAVMIVEHLAPVKNYADEA